MPIQNSVKKIAVIGPLADSKRDMQGAWAGANDADRVVTLLSGLKQKIGNGVQITYAKGSTIKINDTTGFAEAVKVAKDADLVVMALGEAYDQSGESRSRADLSLPGSQDQLFSAVQATGKPVVAVLMAGRPLIFSNIAAKANAIVYAWFLGDQAGNAIADVLTGAVNPSGKLPVTFPRSVGQIPLTYNDYKTGHPYNSNVFQYQTGYIDVPNAPRYAFGHGLSYTTFKYSDLKLDQSTMQKNGKITASLTLTNTGTRAGEEVVQMYIHDPVASVVQPTKKLKGYGKVALEPGASTTIVFIINAETLSFYNQQLKWDAEPGKFKVMIGSASDDIKLQADIELQ